MYTPYVSEAYAAIYVLNFNVATLSTMHNYTYS